MTPRPILGLCLQLSLVAALAGGASAHGGLYPGPRPVPNPIVPPAPSPLGPVKPGPAAPPRGDSGRPAGGPTTPGPSGPSAPTAPGPMTPGSPSPAGPGPTPLTRGAALESDLTSWQYWWAFHQHGYLGSLRAAHAAQIVTGSDLFFMGGSEGVEATRSPTEADVVADVIPLLHRVARESTSRPILASTLLALGKIGREDRHRNLELAPLLRSLLHHDEQTVRECAALALGMCQQPAVLQDLLALVGDDSAGRKLVQRAEVDQRTRAFAAFGLGFLGAGTSDTGVRMRIVAALSGLLAPGRGPERDLRVAALCALRRLRLRQGGSTAENGLATAALGMLWQYHATQLGRSEEYVQAHVPATIASILGRGQSAEHARAKQQMLACLDLDGTLRLPPPRIQSAAIALGLLLDRSAADAAAVALVARASREARDVLARRFALMAMARIGGESSRADLVLAFERGAKGHERPWAALALGVLEREAQDEGAAPDREVGRLLANALAEARNPELAGALAIALGLTRHADAIGLLRTRLLDSLALEETAGHYCIALALLRAREASSDLEQIVRTSLRRPQLMRQAATALGHLASPNVVPLLTDVLRADNPNIARLSAAATALGALGDRRALPILRQMLGDDRLNDLSRAYAAEALGAVADRSPLPWTTAISAHLNYAAASATLSDGSAGLLDIL